MRTGMHNFQHDEAAKQGLAYEMMGLDIHEISPFKSHQDQCQFQATQFVAIYILQPACTSTMKEIFLE